MLIIVCYDIPDNKRREKLRKSLLMYGNPVQYSVFECDLTGRQFEQMTRVVRGIMSKDEDNIRCYQLCGSCLKNVNVFGGRSVEKASRVYVV